MILLLLHLFTIISVISCSFEECTKHCQNSYPLHTSDKVAEYQACSTGCRLSFISRLTTGFMPLIEETCYSDCGFMYQQIDQQFACQVGCKAPFDLVGVQAQEYEKSTDFNLRWHVQLMEPIIVMKKLCISVFDDATSYMQSSYAAEGVNSDGDFFVKIQVSPSMLEEQTNRNIDSKYSISTYMKKAYDHSSQWLHCVEKKSGIPYIHVVTVMLLVLLCISWVCCSTCDDSELERKDVYKRHGFGTVFSVNSGDIEKQPLFTVTDDSSLVTVK